MKRTWMRVCALVIAIVMLAAAAPMALADDKQIFDDVRPADWFAEYVSFVYNRGLMDCVWGMYFQPYEACTRKTVVTALYNLSGKPFFYGPTDIFSDIAPNDDCVDAVAWAVAEGIVYGFDDGTFHPYEPVTREQLAAFMYRYANYSGLRTGYTADFSRFKDVDRISEYALPAFHWAVATGVLYGTDEGTLIPQETATRAQIASILTHFAQGYGF